MADKLFFRTHLGLGDQIICNGLLRYLYQESKYKECIVPSYRRNVSSLKRMFSDLKNLVILPVGDDSEADFWANRFRNENCDVVEVGITGPEIPIPPNIKGFDQIFYLQARVQYENRWNLFHIPSDEKKQKETLDIMNIRQYNNGYVFVHDDASRELIIKSDKLPALPVVRPDHKLGRKSNISIFDYKEVIAHASEIHCMDSSFAALIDHIPELKNKKKVIHRYLREENLNPYYLNNWIIDEKNIY